MKRRGGKGGEGGEREKVGAIGTAICRIRLDLTQVDLIPPISKSETIG